MKNIKNFLRQLDYQLILAIVLARFIFKSEDLATYGIHILITIGIYQILTLFVKAGKIIASCVDFDFSISWNEEEPEENSEEKIETSNLDRALDLLSRESISVIENKDLCLRGWIRVVPLEAAILFVQKLNDKELESWYQENKEIMDSTRDPKKSKPILESMGITSNF